MYRIHKMHKFKTNNTIEILQIHKFKTNKSAYNNKHFHACERNQQETH